MLKKNCIIGCETRKHTTVGEALSIYDDSVQALIFIVHCTNAGLLILHAFSLVFYNRLKKRKIKIEYLICLETIAVTLLQKNCMSIKFFSKKIQYIYFTSAILMTARKKTWPEVDTQNRFLARMRKANDCYANEITFVEKEKGVNLYLYKIVLKKQMAAMRGNVLRQLL